MQNNTAKIADVLLMAKLQNTKTKAEYKYVGLRKLVKSLCLVLSQETIIELLL
jgi:hypothetical protein